MERGRLIAKVLAGSWRGSPAPLELSTAQLDVVAPMLLTTGAGALGWRRIGNSNLRSSPRGLELEQAYRLHALQSAINERNVASALRLLRSAGIDPILVKGWAAARLYPDSGLRPHGDMDLCVAPEQYQGAKSALEKALNRTYQVDLHRGVKKLDPGTFNEIYSRYQMAHL